MPRVNNLLDVEALRHLFLHKQSNINALENLGVPQNTYTTILRTKVMRGLPSELQLKWGREEDVPANRLQTTNGFFEERNFGFRNIRGLADTIQTPTPRISTLKKPLTVVQKPSLEHLLSMSKGNTAINAFIVANSTGTTSAKSFLMSTQGKRR